MKILHSPLVCYLLALSPILGLRCELDCEDDACVETITRVSKKACHKLARSPRWLSRIPPKQHFTVHQKRTSVEITLTRDREPGSVLLLTVPAHGGRQCFNITTPGNQTYSINDGKARTRLKCSGVRISKKWRRIKLYDLTNRKILGSQLVEKKLETLKPTQRPPVERLENGSRQPRTATCSCMIPDVVYLKPKCVSPGNYTMTISWVPFYNSSDLRIGIVPEGDSDVFVTNGHRKLPRWKLLTQRLQEDTFTNLELKSGSKYIGLVGSLGCNSCMRYKESEALRVQCSNKGPAPSDQTPVTDIKATMSSSKSPMIVYAVIGVGAFAFIGVLALGVFLLKMRHGKRYGALPASDSSASLASVAQVSVVRSSDVDDVVRAAENLVSQLQQRGKTTMSTLASDVTEVSTAASDLIFHVTSGSEPLPTCLKQLTSKTVTVLHHGNRKPDVIVPRDFQFCDLLNNLMACGRNLDLDDFLNKLGPAHIDVGLSKVKALLLSCDSGEDDSPLSQATRELVRLLREKLAITVVYPQETEQHLQEQRNMGINTWAKEKLAACNLVIVVPSQDVADVHTGDASLNNSVRIVRGAIASLKQSCPERRPEVCVVTFGYWKEHVESVWMHFPTCRTFSLLETDSGDPVDLRHNLKPFFSWLCPDMALVELACRDGQDFLLNADRMCCKVHGTPTVLEDMI
ncbi:uncharacterized protein [Haliotis asinina]|uniref:uncharacterized protein n=1 Tax=Haliotis asinina TaxID=109174 RepID=UPI0035324133